MIVSRADRSELFAVKADSAFIRYERAVPGLAVPFLTKEGDLYVREWTDTLARTPRSRTPDECEEEVAAHG